ncbi:MAG: hypothetical protein AAF789_14800, partial [Bacteroidota bacterium]
MDREIQNTSVSISRARFQQLNLDFESMRQLGIQWLQDLSGNIWTDYNLHDPGVTILENLCYALLDLAYRTELPIEELLFHKDRLEDWSEQSKAEDQSFFEADQIFSVSPLTLQDYRKLILDRIPEVKNIWLDPLYNNQYGIQTKGRYQVSLQIGR